MAERRTLWAIRCRLGELAKVTEGSGGAFEPRAKVLRYSTPLTNGAGAAVIEITCREARRVAAASRPAPTADTPNEKPAPAPGLKVPPSLFETDGLHEDDEQAGLGNLPRDHERISSWVAASGHNRPVSRSQQRSFERRLRSETCRMSYFRTSAQPAIDQR